jgi:DNA-binding CsgD family transcriptional regulator
VDIIRSNASEGRDSGVDRFADETLAVVCRALGAEWGSFYRLGGNLRPFGFRNRGVPEEFGTAYACKAMDQIDPLHPFRLVPRKRRFLTMGDARAESPERHRDFLSFLRSFGAEEAGEMIFRCDGQAVAGLSLVWRGRKPDRHATSDLGTSLHAYIEFNLGNVWQESALQSQAWATSRYEFTSREMEVIDVVCRGYTNPEIAKHLNIGLATVKTHLIHVFKKVGVETRGELISRMLAAGGGSH